MTTTLDIAIIGAGPYGLAAAAHLREADSLEIAVFGEPMSFWSNHMPRGMFLRSPYVASSISDPADRLSLGAYENAMGLERAIPVPLDRFVDYGNWFQRQVLPDLAPVRVASVERNHDGFVVNTGDDAVHARRVIVAGGINDFALVPDVYRGLPPALVSHAADHSDLAQFFGSSVLVIGGGQSALESAALLAESGAAVEVVVRADHVNWLIRRWHHKLGPVSKALYAWPDVGPAGVSHFVALPDLFRRTPRRTQTWMTTKALRPAGSAWLVPRLQRVPIHVGREVVEAGEQGGRVRVTFDNGAVQEFDHVLLGTGYRVDVSRYPFLAPELVRDVRRVDGYPVLRRGFESSVSGMHFLGAPAAWSFGPLMRFVAGTSFAGSELVRGVFRGRLRSKTEPWPRPRSA